MELQHPSVVVKLRGRGRPLSTEVSTGEGDDERRKRNK